MDRRVADLVELSREMGREDRSLAILAEGNASWRLSPTEFAVKSSGACLANLTEAEVTVCSTPKILQLLDLKAPTDQAVESALLEARVDPASKKPSVETLFHAWLLGLEGVNVVGHCHPVAVNQILCSPRARDFAERRIFPDEVVCCGPASVFVPYVDPGWALAREIRERVQQFIREHRLQPRLILLQNHGLIALGSNAPAVLACTRMATKAAEIFLGAAALGGPNFLTAQQVERLAGRIDEAYRQRQLKINP